jgi:hypothetical protein
MPRGGLRSTSFKPGKGGPGRPKKKAEEKAAFIAKKAIADIKAAAKEHSIEALQALTDVLGNVKAPAAARVSAATAILDRGWGKPHVTIGGDPENPLAFKDVTGEVSARELIAGRIASVAERIREDGGPSRLN